MEAIERKINLIKRINNSKKKNEILQIVRRLQQLRLAGMTDDAGNQIFQITKGNERIWYVEEDGKKEIVEIFVKGNHQTTDQARKK